MYDADSAPDGLDPMDTSDPHGIELLTSKGFTELGREICVLDPPEQDGLDLDLEVFAGDGERFYREMERRGTTAVILRDAGGRVAVSPESTPSGSMSSFLSLLSTGHLVETRRAPARARLRPMAEIVDHIAELRGEADAPALSDSPGLTSFVEWSAGVSEDRAFSDLPARGLFRRTVSGAIDAVYAAHLEHLEEACRRGGADAVPIVGMRLYLAMLRRRNAVLEADVVGANKALLWAGGLLGATAVALLAWLFLWSGMVWPWLALAVVGPVMTQLIGQQTSSGIAQLVLFASPVWLTLMAASVETPPGTVARVFLLSTLVWCAWFSSAFAGIALCERVYPKLSARVAQPPLVAAEELTGRYGDP